MTNWNDRPGDTPKVRIVRCIICKSMLPIEYTLADVMEWIRPTQHAGRVLAPADFFYHHCPTCNGKLESQLRSMHDRAMSDLTIDHIMAESSRTAHEKGWLDQGGPSFVERIMLVVTELSEAVEEWRAGRSPDDAYDVDGKPCGIPSELADAVIRIAELSQELGVDLSGAIRDKMAYNQTRPYRHGGKRM